MYSQTQISFSNYSSDKVQKIYLQGILSFITIIHLIEIINFIFQRFPILVFINFSTIIFNLFFLRKYMKLKNIDKTIKHIIIIESISIFIHILFIWKVYPEVFIWTGCVVVPILLFFNEKELLKYVFFNSLLFISAPTISLIFGLSDFFISTVENFEHIHFQLLYLNIIGATFLLILITLSYKKYVLLKNTSNKINFLNETEGMFLKNSYERENNVNKIHLNRLFEKIKHYIENEKKYLDPNFNLKELSLVIGSNISYVSKCINIHNKSNFNDFINSYRINYFKNLITHIEVEKRLPIKDIYSKCGFKQQSTFNRVFKQFEGVTPTEYIYNNSLN